MRERSMTCLTVLCLALTPLMSATASGQCPADGCCFEAHVTPGCDVADCCEAVCLVDSFCCDSFWDQGCANEAIISCPTTPPCNDLCANATALELPVIDLNYNTANAQTDGPPVPGGCFADGTTFGADVWYSFVVPEDGALFVNNCLTAGFDTMIAVYTGTCGSLNLLACNEDGVGCGGTGSTIQVDVTAGTAILLRLGGADGATGQGTIDVQIASDLCPGQGGDCCDNNGTPGCDDVGCCSVVCGADPFCCQVSWDQICADEAFDMCGDVCIPPTCGEIDAGSCCVANSTSACNDATCCNTVCTTIPACCDVEWDQACVDMAVVACADLCACTVTSSPGSSPENEACGTSTNGGCNSTPPVFGAIACGGTVFGNAWADGGTRDTDWYTVQVTGGPMTLQATVVSEFPSVLFFLDGIGTCESVVVGTSGGSEGCDPGQPATATLDPGSYVLFVGAGDAFDGGGIFDGFPCGSQNEYEVTLTCAAPCVGDTNGDNIVNVDDLVNVILDWGTNGAANGGDVDGSGFVNVDDLVTVILAWGPC